MNRNWLYCAGFNGLVYESNSLQITQNQLCHNIRQHQLRMMQLYRAEFGRNSVRVKDLCYNYVQESNYVIIQ